MQIKPYSPVASQDFVWAAEYANGDKLIEFDPHTGEPNKFQLIIRQDLVRFGIVGLGHKIYTEMYGGFLVVNGQMFEVVYRVGHKDYYLTGQPKLYSDIISYKDAEAIANVSAKGEPQGRFTNRITQFNFGYKVQLEIDGVNFNFRAIYSIPYGKPAYMTFRLVADKDLDGLLVVRKNGQDVAVFEAPLGYGVGGELSWNVR